MSDPNCIMCRGEGEYATFSPAQMVRCGCKTPAPRPTVAPSPPPVSPSEATGRDVEGLVDRLNAGIPMNVIHSPGGDDIRRVPDFEAAKEMVREAAAALTRLSGERDVAQFGFEQELRIKQELAGALRTTQAALAERDRRIAAALEVLDKGKPEFDWNNTDGEARMRHVREVGSWAEVAVRDARAILGGGR